MVPGKITKHNIQMSKFLMYDYEMSEILIPSEFFEVEYFKKIRTNLILGLCWTLKTSCDNNMPSCVAMHCTSQCCWNTYLCMQAGVWYVAKAKKDTFKKVKKSQWNE